MKLFEVIYDMNVPLESDLTKTIIGDEVVQYKSIVVAKNEDELQDIIEQDISYKVNVKLNTVVELELDKNVGVLSTELYY